MKVHPNLVAYVSANLIVEELAIEALSGSAKTQIVVSDAEKKYTASLVVKREDVPGDSRPLDIGERYVGLVIPEFVLSTRP